jgi:hypothetical protein
VSELDAAASEEARALAGRTLRSGWRTLLVFVLLGFALEALHGFKVGWYLDLDNETRRMLWRLAHAHGALLSVLTIAYALGVAAFPGTPPARVRLVAKLLLTATIALPGGFFLGGLVVHGGDPGLGIVLAPLGAVALVAGVWLAGGSASR